MYEAISLTLRLPQITLWQMLLVSLAICMSLGSFVAPYVVDSQTWMHVELGESILQSGRLPRGTQAVDGYCWINDCYLSQVIMAIIAQIGGAMGLSTVSCAIGLAGIASMILFNRRDQIRWSPTLTAAALSLALLSSVWRVGPQIASLVCFTTLLVLLQFAFEGWRGKFHWTGLRGLSRSDWEPGADNLKYDSVRLRALWLVGPIFCLWSNMDGAFRSGLLIVWTYLAVRAFEAVCQRGRAGYGLVRRMVLMGTIAGLATLLNPYGPWLHGWLSNPNTQSLRDVLHGPSLSVGGITSGLFVITLAFWLASQMLAIRHRQCDLAQSAALAVAAVLATSDSSNVAFFAIAAGFWIAAPALQLETTMYRIAHDLLVARPRWLRIGRDITGDKI